jgi:hypothetical protein
MVPYVCPVVSIWVEYPELPLLFLMACMMAIQKVPSGEKLTKQAMRKKLYTKLHMYLSYFSM